MKPTLTYVYGPPFDYAKKKMRDFYGAATEAEACALGKEWCGIGGIVSPYTCPPPPEIVQIMAKCLDVVQKCIVAGIDPADYECVMKFPLADDEPMFDFGWVLPKERFILFDSIQPSHPGSIPL